MKIRQLRKTPDKGDTVRVYQDNGKFISGHGVVTKTRLKYVVSGDYFQQVVYLDWLDMEPDAYCDYYLEENKIKFNRNDKIIISRTHNSASCSDRKSDQKVK